MFERNNIIFNNLIKQYFRLWEMKNEISQTLITLPNEERTFLERELELKRDFEYYEEQIGLAIIRYNRIITLDQVSALIYNIDQLTNELKSLLLKYDKNSRIVVQKTKDILKWKVGPFLFGSAMVGSDIYLKNLATIIGGFYIIYNALILG